MKVDEVLKIRVISNYETDSRLNDWLIKLIASKILVDPSFQEMLYASENKS